MQPLNVPSISFVALETARAQLTGGVAFKNGSRGLIELFIPSNNRGSGIANLGFTNRWLVRFGFKCFSWLQRVVKSFSN